VPDLLRSVLLSGESGTLTFRQGEVQKTIYLQDGRVVYARSSDPDERLGEVLLQHGKITVRQYLEASRQIRPGRRLGAILVEMEALEADELLPSVEQHVKEILLDIFTWTTGEYAFVMTDPGVSELVTLNLSMENLILEGIRKLRAWRRIYDGVGGLDVVLVPTGNTDVLYKLSLTEEEQEVLSHVSGRATVEQICQVSYLSNFETCRALWGFQILGLLRRGQATEAAAAGEGARVREEEMDVEAIVERLNQTLGRIYGFLAGRGAGDVDVYMDEALKFVSRKYEALFYDIDLSHYGRADYDQLLANVADLPPNQRRQLMIAGLTELLKAVASGIRRSYGAQEQAVVDGIVKEGFRKLGSL